MEPRSLTYVFLSKCFLLGAVHIAIIAIVTPAVMEKQIHLGDCQRGTLRLV